MQLQPTEEELLDLRKYQRRMFRFSVQVEKKGRRWCRKLIPKFQRYPAGTIVAVNIETGQYTAAPEVEAVVKKLNRRFGKNRAAHWVVRLAEDEHGKKYDSWVYSL